MEIIMMLELLKSTNFWFAICFITIIVVAIAFIKRYLRKILQNNNKQKTDKK